MNTAVANPAPTARTRVLRRAVHGVLLLDKPLGWSSNDALQKAKWLLRAEKAGHTGTLDPMATGLLPLCFGAATKFSQVSLDADKGYEAEVQLGVVTTTGDAEGEVLQRLPVQVTAEAIEAALQRWRGPIRQRPPMHSALKHQGRPLYEYARQGVEVERAEREVTIHELSGQWQPEMPDRLRLQVRCSKGTYIRTLAADIGQTLGCGASLIGLRRTGSGALKVVQAVSLAQLEALDEAGRLACLQPVDALLQDWPPVVLPAPEAARFITGLRRRWSAPDCAAVRVYGPPLEAAGSPLKAPGVLLGSAHLKAGELIPDRLLSPIEIAALGA